MAIAVAQNPARRELVFGFVAPLGVDKKFVAECLRTALCTVGYDLLDVHVTDKLQTFAECPRDMSLDAVGFLQRKKILMDAGDKIRQQWNARSRRKRGDAVALAAMIGVTESRERAASALGHNQSKNPEEPCPACGRQSVAPVQTLSNAAFLIDSLKHQDELRLLRRVYGPAFISIAIYSPPEKRKEFLLKNSEKQDGRTKIFIDHLMRRDETGENEQGVKIAFGQDVGNAFPDADFILDASLPEEQIKQQLTRLVRLIFGDALITPTRDEIGMSLATVSQVRSSSLARQIGAAIVRRDASVVAIGTNEAAKPMGGQYLPEDDHEYHGRDKDYSARDTSDEFRSEMVDDILERLDDACLLDARFSKYKDGSNELRADVDPEDVRRSRRAQIEPFLRERQIEADENNLLEAIDDAHMLKREFSTYAMQEITDENALRDLRERRLQDLYYADNAPLRRALIRDNIDYVRDVHAEAAAILDAARHGTAVKKCTMYTTTFPCHECARHIVAAGIRELVYLAPYPKSANGKLYRDSIQIDPDKRDKRRVTFRTFTGVGPRRYLEFFTMRTDRKRNDGTVIEFDLRAQGPDLPYYTPAAQAAAANEQIELESFKNFLKDYIATTQPQPTGGTT
jgi:deoxycytidylate deaminase